MSWLKMSAIALLGVGWATWLFAQDDDSADSVAEPSGRQKWALLIGINDYAEISDLKYCRRDIEVLRERLVTAGFPKEQITLLHDGAKQSLHQPFKTSIEYHLERILEDVGPDDLVVFAFSGHGVDLDGASYICPIEARLTDPEKTLVSLEYVYRRFAACRARQKVLLVDACRDDPRPGGERGIVNSTDLVKGFARSLSRPPEGILVLTSCKPGQMSVEDDKLGHSVFMHFILKGLRGEADRDGGNGNGRVSLFELYRYANLRTRAYVARSRDLIQTPVLRGRVTADFEIAEIVTRTQEIEALWSNIRHGVFMHYVLEGLQGEADRGDDGNNDGRISLLELYGYASLKTKTHVARTRNLVQTPMLRGKVVGDYEIAVALPRRPEKLPSRFYRGSYKDLDTILAEDPEVIVAADPKAQFALRHAYDLLLANWTFAVSDGIPKVDCDKALAACNEAIRLEPQNPFAYLLRGVAYRRRGDYAEALADLEKLNLPLRVVVGYQSIDGVQLETADEVSETVDPGDRLTVAEVRGDRLRISAAIPLGRVGGRADEKSGWIDKIVLQPELKEFQDERRMQSRNVRWETVSRRRVDPSDRLGTITAEDPHALDALQRAHDILADDVALGYAAFRRDLTDEEVNAAIAACNEAIGLEPENQSALRLRAMSYRYQRDFDRALADLKMLEQPLELRVTSRTANLMGGSDVTATVAYGEMLNISGKNGDWLWVQSVRGQEDKKGWIQAEHVARRDLLTSRTFERVSRATGQSYGSATPIRDTVIERAIGVGRGYIPYGGFLPF